MLPDLPLRVWLGILAIPVAFACLAVVVWVWAFRASDRREAKRQSMIAQFLASRGAHLSAEDADCERVAAALLELRDGGAPFDIYWVAACDGGTLFEYRVGPGIGKHGYGYLERSFFLSLTNSVRITPRARWMSIDYTPTFGFGREVGEGWANPEFHKRYEVHAQDVAEGSQVATSRLQFLLLELPDVSGKAVDRELVEVAVNRSHWTVLGRKLDWGAKKIGDGFPDIENHLRLAGRIRDAFGR
jgi:hypothetical protein